MTHLNQRKLSCKDLTQITYDIQLVKIRSTKLIEYLIIYFMEEGFNSASLQECKPGRSVRFFHSIGLMHGKIDNKEFLNIVNEYIKLDLLVFDAVEV